MIKIGKARASAPRNETPRVKISVSYGGLARDYTFYSVEGVCLPDAKKTCSHILVEEDIWKFVELPLRSPPASRRGGRCLRTTLTVPAEDLDALQAEIERGFAVVLPKRELVNTKLRIRNCIQKLRPLLIDLVRRGETLDSLDSELAAMCKEVLVEAVQEA